jgi:hypothetical protein
MDARSVEGSSEDFICIDTENWTNEDVATAQKVRAELGYFKAGNAIISRLSRACASLRSGAGRSRTNALFGIKTARSISAVFFGPGD